MPYNSLYSMELFLNLLLAISMADNLLTMAVSATDSKFPGAMNVSPAGISSSTGTSSSFTLVPDVFWLRYSVSALRKLNLPRVRLLYDILLTS